MATIVPRWEWRTFARSFPRATQPGLERLAAGRVQESEELYLFTPATGNVKVRDDLMDVKVLRETNADGLERWEPVLKAAFPLVADDVAAVLEALGVADANVDGDYPLDRFIEELAVPNGIRPITVRKRRVRSTIGACMAESTDIDAEGRTTRTVAVESEDAAAVTALVRELGFAAFRNVNYLVGLATLVDDEGDRYAVLDVGTNSVKFHVAEREDPGWRVVVDRAEVTRLGEGLQAGGTIGEGPLARTADAIVGMVEEADRLHARAIAAVGTAGLRIASNRDAVLTAIRERTGLAVEVIPGDEEARLAYLAVVASLDVGDGPVVVFDTGGGSSQFTFGRGSDVQDRFSVDVGAARFTERFGLDRAVDRGAVEDAMAAIEQELARLDGRSSPDAVVGMGGAVTNLTAVALELEPYDPDRVQGARLTRAEIDRQIERYRSLDAEGRRSITGLQPKRAEVILAGACIVRTVLAKLGRDELTVSDRGLRHGVLAERFG